MLFDVDSDDFYTKSDKTFSGIGLLRKICQHFTIYNQPRMLTLSLPLGAFGIHEKILPSPQEEECYLANTNILC